MSGKPVIAVFTHSNAQKAYFGQIAILTGCDVGGLSDDPSLILATKMPDTDFGERPVICMGGMEDVREDANVQVISGPVKAAALIDRIGSIFARRNTGPQKIIFAQGALDRLENTWTNTGEPAIRLTDREVEILTYLYDAKGKTVGRDDLLRHVWAYAKDVQTHTLETHIYRLRQKIEADPAAPKILLTTEGGYAISI